MLHLLAGHVTKKHKITLHEQLENYEFINLI